MKPSQLENHYGHYPTIIQVETVKQKVMYGFSVRMLKETAYEFAKKILRANSHPIEGLVRVDSSHEIWGTIVHCFEC
ncbi:hypothetical protein H4R18_000791 [Coemansia javaensis]|uniref:Uncharacterized protein n=1 Tax=Coemansia javaensis TaxID=2761396 RepID=A0A9W8HNF6_9FUNG|nr:hypothetical protein H4R18_000791 [Coemansia javaensis]